MKRFVSDFKQWSRVFENRSEEDPNQELEHLSVLADLGFIDDVEVKKVLRTRGVPDIIKYTKYIQEIVDSPEYGELQEHGLELVSSKTQLLNGSIIFGRPGYRSHDSYAIGLFPGPKLIRRMTPKGISLGIRGRRIGSMDFRIKDLRDIPESQFYRVAMRWILDHIDFNDPKFSVKSRTRKGYFNQD
jgi:hypothetical protein